MRRSDGAPHLHPPGASGRRTRPSCTRSASSSSGSGASLHVMEREREHLTRDIEHARSLAATGWDPRSTASPSRAIEENRLLSLIGIGNHFRRDDAAGLEVARRLRAHPSAGLGSDRAGGRARLADRGLEHSSRSRWWWTRSAPAPSRAASIASTSPHAPLPAEIFKSPPMRWGCRGGRAGPRAGSAVRRASSSTGSRARTSRRGRGSSPGVEADRRRAGRRAQHELAGGRHARARRRPGDRRRRGAPRRGSAAVIESIA